MGNLFKGKLVIGFVIAATVILAGVAIFTAIRLYQTGRSSDKLVTSESPSITQEPEIVVAGELSFTIQAQEVDPTPTPTVQISSPTPTLIPTAFPTSTPTSTLTPSPTIMLTTTPTVATSTPTPTVTRTDIPTPTPTTEQLPDAGSGLPTLLLFGLGIIMISLALVLVI